LPHIFERFYRVGATRQQYTHPQGSGLGLSIAKSIVDIHGGKIWAASELGKGKTFFHRTARGEKIKIVPVPRAAMPSKKFDGYS
jgi:histidine kinase